MRETTRIADQLQRAYAGHAWHGPSLRFLLRGLTARQAASHPISGAHSIWELVLHITAWDRVARQRILGGRRTGLGPHRNFPPVTRSTAAAWKQALRDLAREHRALEAAVQKFPPARLDRKLSGGDHSFYFTMHGILQHDLYHAGQIAILRKGLRR